MDISDGKRDMLTMENLASSDNTPSKPKSNKFYSHLAHTVVFFWKSSVVYSRHFWSLTFTRSVMPNVGTFCFYGDKEHHLRVRDGTCWTEYAFHWYRYTGSMNTSMNYCSGLCFTDLFFQTLLQVRLGIPRCSKKALDIAGGKIDR